jgi:hypothetical protein
MAHWRKIKGTVVEGYRVASGLAEDSPYPEGTIDMQIPHFLERGIDLRPFYPATVGVSCSPLRFQFENPRFTFRDVKWSPEHDPEDFSFSACRVVFEGRTYEGFVYYPHPETKIDHHHDESTLEIVVPFVEGLRYGAELELEINTQEISVRE